MAQMRAAASSLPPEALASQASAAASQFSAQSKYQYDAAAQLKAEGNRLHGSKLWRQAADKYERAISNLEGERAACEGRGNGGVRGGPSERAKGQ